MQKVFESMPLLDIGKCIVVLVDLCWILIINWDPDLAIFLVESENCWFCFVLGQFSIK